MTGNPNIPVNTEPEVYDSLAYIYDGSIEGLLCAVFASYFYHEKPDDITPSEYFQPRLSQHVRHIETDYDISARVQSGITRQCGSYTFKQVIRASASSEPDAAHIIYSFIRYAMDEHAGKRRAVDNIAHPAVSRIHKLIRAVNNECEKMRQFARFEHMQIDDGDIWLSKINPRDAVVPFILHHFVERFSIQPFIIFDENHGMAGVWDGHRSYLVNTDGTELLEKLKQHSFEEPIVQEAWRKFYRAVAIDERYHPELRRNFMPVRLWKNITEMQEMPDSNKLLRTDQPPMADIPRSVPTLS